LTALDVFGVLEIAQNHKMETANRIGNKREIEKQKKDFYQKLGKE